MSAEPRPARQLHVLIYEPRVEGHHVDSLGLVAEELTEAGFHLTLAIDIRPDSLRRIREQTGGLLERTCFIPAGDPAGRPGKGSVEGVAACLAQSGADSVFIHNFDEIASAMLRRAGCGQLPPAMLHGRCGGIYSRPRFLAGRGFSPNLWLKSLGFARLLRQGWFRQLLFPDPYLHAQLQTRYPDAPIFHIPTPIPDNFAADRGQALGHFKVPAGRQVLLFYGGAYRRKGFDLAVEAMLALPPRSPAFLLCVGEQPKDPQAKRGLAALVAAGRARAINRYVSMEEEQLAFAAADFVLLPYRQHFGSSGVLVRAVAAGKPVIASDEQLVGRLVREHELGLLFPTGNASALQGALERAVTASAAEVQRWQASAKAYAPACSRAAYRRALLGSFGLHAPPP